MKKTIAILSLLFLVNCISRNNEKYVLRDHHVILKAKFNKVDSYEGFLLYHFRNDSIEGVFISNNDKNFKSPNYKKIKLNKKYTLILSKQIIASRRTVGEIDQTIITDKGVLIWKTGMKAKYFESCENIIADKINPRFTLLKYIDPHPYHY